MYSIRWRQVHFVVWICLFLLGIRQACSQPVLAKDMLPNLPPTPPQSAEDQTALGVRSAIVTTVRRPNKAMWSDFLCYHLGLGFDHVFVFFDDADDEVRWCVFGRLAVWTLYAVCINILIDLPAGVYKCMSWFRKPSRQRHRSRRVDLSPGSVETNCGNFGAAPLSGRNSGRMQNPRWFLAQFCANPSEYIKQMELSVGYTPAHSTTPQPRVCWHAHVTQTHAHFLIYA